MQLFATYTSVWNEGEVTTNAAVCTVSRSIVMCETSNEGEDYQHHSHDFLQVEHDGKYFDFECEQGELTAVGKKDFENLLTETILKQKGL